MCCLFLKCLDSCWENGGHLSSGIWCIGFCQVHNRRHKFRCILYRYSHPNSTHQYMKYNHWKYSYNILYKTHDTYNKTVLLILSSNRQTEVIKLNQSRLSFPQHKDQHSIQLDLMYSQLYIINQYLSIQELSHLLPHLRSYPKYIWNMCLDRHKQHSQLLHLLTQRHNKWHMLNHISYKLIHPDNNHQYKMSKR